MGAWGAGPFENDDALDFIDGLIDLPAPEREAQIRAALTLRDGHLEASDANTAIAAAGLVAAANGMPFEDKADIAELIESGGIPAADQVRELAFAALSKVTDHESELAEPLGEADLLDETQAALDKIRISLEA